MKVKDKVNIVALPIGKKISDFRQLILSVLSGISCKLVRKIIPMFVDGSRQTSLDVDWRGMTFDFGHGDTLTAFGAYGLPKVPPHVSIHYLPPPRLLPTQLDSSDIIPSTTYKSCTVCGQMNWSISTNGDNCSD